MRLRQNVCSQKCFITSLVCWTNRTFKFFSFVVCVLTLSFIVNHCILNCVNIKDHCSNYSFVSKDIKHCVTGHRVKMIYFIASHCLIQCSRVIYEWRGSGSFNIVPLMLQVYSSVGHICIISEW